MKTCAVVGCDTPGTSEVVQHWRREVKILLCADHYDVLFGEDPPGEEVTVTAVNPYAVCGCGHRYDHHRDWGDLRGPGCWLCKCGSYDPEGGK